MQDQNIPLAARMRPKNLNEFVGQSHVLGQNRLLRRAIISKKITSLILSGPAGCGKTSLGFIVAGELGADFQYLNAAFSSVSEVKKAIASAKQKLAGQGIKTAIFIDEIHRFSKLQQEALVPDTESGSIILIGATIYNPFYYLIPSLISRSIVARFKPLIREDVLILLKRALTDKERGLGGLDIEVTDKALEHIVEIAGGDARSALGAVEVAAQSTQSDNRGKIMINLEVAKESIQKKILYDRKDSYHYDTISAFIKSVRGSDPDSALYWLAKMLKAGEDPRFIARRLVILASEDIGNANPFALVLATSCFQAVEFIGLPEAQLNLAQVTIYLAASPKSNSAYLAIKNASEDVEEEETQEVPEHIKTHSKDYKYPHKFGGYVQQAYGAKKKYYFPKAIGEENRLKQFLENLNT
ncbi:MAG: replication-associated recombination protein A [Candidatus Omnitrophica bacterium]|nr:replication-associated recombination protein A [Candidatus Omnitrophota bacterium]MBU2473443.1 replication-associated recombination protein A [Candidatus Omnitrophota bacterium]